MSDSSFPEPVQWNGDEQPELPSKVVKYECLDCKWSGLAQAAVTHHRADHHRIIVRNAPRYMGPMKFSCCADMREKPSHLCQRAGCDRTVNAFVFAIIVPGLGTFCSLRCAEAQKAAGKKA